MTPKPVRELNPEVPQWLAATVERLHAKQPADRFGSAAEAAELLWYNLEHPDQPRQVPRPRPPRRRRSRRWLLTRVLAGILLLLGGLVLSETLHWTHLTGRASQLTLRTELRGHEGPVWSVAFAPDSKTVATGSDDKSIRLWDTRDGQEKTILRGQDNYAIGTVVFAHSGKFLVSIDYAGALHVWDVASGKEGPPLPPHTGSSRRMALAPDDKTLAIGNAQNVELWDLKSRTVRQSLQGHKNTVGPVAFAPDGRTLASGDNGGHVILWDLQTGNKRAELQGDSIRMAPWPSLRTARS